MAVFENANALPRIFAPRKIRLVGDAGQALAEMSGTGDFSERAWIAGTTSEVKNGTAEISLRAAGPDLVAAVNATQRVFLATSLPDWPAWIAESAGGRMPLLTTNH